MTTKQDARVEVAAAAICRNEKPCGVCRGKATAALAAADRVTGDEICAACGHPHHEHVTPGGTRYGTATLCGAFIPQEADRHSTAAVEAAVKVRAKWQRIVDGKYHTFTTTIGGACAAQAVTAIDEVIVAIRRGEKA